MTPLLTRPRQVRSTPTCRSRRFTPRRHDCRYGVTHRAMLGTIASSGSSVILPPITYVASATATANAALGITVNKPAGTAVGDLMIVLLAATSAARTWNVPAGWAVVPTTAAGDRSVALYRIADGSEGATLAFTHTGAAIQCRAGIVTLTGTGASPFDAASFQQAAAGTSNAIPGVTVGTGRTLFSLMFLIGSPATLTAPGTMVQDFQVNVSNSFAGASETAVVGATGSRTWTWTGSFVSAGLLCSLK